MKRAILVLPAILSIFLPGRALLAGPATADDAVKVVKGWLRVNPQPLGTSMDRTIKTVEAFTDASSQPVYYIVALDPSGFVIVPADTRVDPVIGFAQTGTYDQTPGAPLASLVANDVKHRLLTMTAADAGMSRTNAEAGISIAAQDDSTNQAVEKWHRYTDIAEQAEGEISIAGLGGKDVEDPRVSPLLETRWGQTTCYVERVDEADIPQFLLKEWPYMADTGLACYNFYTPPGAAGDPCNYPCGCVATAVAQLMQHHQWPQAEIGSRAFNIRVKKGSEWTTEKRSTLGGDGKGGPYDWKNMPPLPDGTNRSECRAIGALCHDVGVSLSMNYAREGSDPCNALDISSALMQVFGYAEAVVGVRAQNGDPVNIGRTLTRMINPNLEAGSPVILLIKDTTKETGHAAVCDGYGFHEAAPYYHLNMGEAASMGECLDLWYQLIRPDIDGGCSYMWPEANVIYSRDWSWHYDTVLGCVYNISSQTRGEIISGQVLDTTGVPIKGVVVVAETADDKQRIQDTTDAHGIYALAGCRAETEYTLHVEAQGRYFPDERVKTGTSIDGSFECGNVCGVLLRENYPNGWVFYVDAKASKNSGAFQDGSVEHPFDTIEEAIGASTHGDTIVLLPGIYKGTGNRDLVFWGKAITVRSVDPNDPVVVEATAIDCEGMGRAFEFFMGEQSSSVVAGITIRNGRAQYGGAVVCRYASLYVPGPCPMFRNVRFESNAATGRSVNAYPGDDDPTWHWDEGYPPAEGGAVFIEEGSPTFVGCFFKGNSSTGVRTNGAGAVWVNDGDPTFINCQFVSNEVASKGRSGGSLGHRRSIHG